MQEEKKKNNGSLQLTIGRDTVFRMLIETGSNSYKTHETMYAADS